MFIHLISQNIQIMRSKFQMLVKNVGQHVVTHSKQYGGSLCFSQQNKEDQTDRQTDRQKPT